MTDESVEQTVQKPERVFEGYSIIRLVLGAVVLVACGLKYRELGGSPPGTSGLQSAPWFSISVVGMEFILSLCLLSGIWRRAVWITAIGCFLYFACVTAWKVWIGERSCGCFGRMQVDPRFTLLLDVAVLGVLIRWRPHHYPVLPSRGSLAVLVVAVVGIGVPAGIKIWSTPIVAVADETQAFGSGPLVVLDSKKWIGRRFPLLEFIDIGGQFDRGKWTVVLYNHKCSHCQAAIAEYVHLAEALARKPDSRRVALVEMPPYAESNEWRLPNSLCQWGRLNMAKEWFAQTPVTLSLLDGEVVEASEGDSGR